MRLSGHCIRGIAGGIRVLWLVVLLALLLSLMRWDSLAEARERGERRAYRSGRRPWLAEAYFAVVLASFLMHFAPVRAGLFFRTRLRVALLEFMAKRRSSFLANADMGNQECDGIR